MGLHHCYHRCCDLTCRRIITPAITVVSAVEGLNGLLPSLPVVPIALIIIAAIFLVQPLGTARLGKPFGRIMFYGSA